MTKWETALLIAFGLIAGASALDIWNDLSAGATSSHLLSEGLIVLVTLVLMAWLGLRLRAQAHALLALKNELWNAKNEAARTTSEVLEARQHFSTFIQQQFQRWELSASEQEVALLMIKGLSLKEIAQLRATAEKTVRQQASAIYKKANLSGRHALSAWFIEDFLQV